MGARRAGSRTPGHLELTPSQICSSPRGPIPGNSASPKRVEGSFLKYARADLSKSVFLIFVRGVAYATDPQLIGSMKRGSGGTFKQDPWQTPVRTLARGSTNNASS